jgi:hypothetical protein
MQANRIARFEYAAAECAEMESTTRDPWAKAVLATAAIVWGKLVAQRNYQGSSKQLDDLVDLLDTAIVDRGSPAIRG